MKTYKINQFVLAGSLFGLCLIITNTTSTAQDFDTFDSALSQIKYLNELNAQFDLTRKKSYELLREGELEQAKVALLRSYENYKTSSDWHLAYFSDLYYFCAYSKEKGAIKDSEKHGKILLNSVNRYLKKALPEEHDSQVFLQLKADVYAKILNDYASAEQHLNEAIANDPENSSLINKKTRLTRKLK